MTILLTDYGGTTPSDTCEMIADDTPTLYRAYGFRRVLAVCEEIQFSEIPEQSRLYQRMFQRFNIRYSPAACLTIKSWWFTTSGIGRQSDVDIRLLDPANPQPRVINVDKNRAYPTAVEELRVEGTLRRRCRLRQCKYGSAQESDNLPERPAFSERWLLASLRG